MSAIKTNIELEFNPFFEVDGQVVVEVTAPGSDEPVAIVHLNLYSMVKEYVDAVVDHTGEIHDSDAVEMAYAIADEMQDCVDFLYNSIGDPDDV